MEAGEGSVTSSATAVVPGALKAASYTSSGCAEEGDPTCGVSVTTVGPEISTSLEEEAAAFCCLVCEHEPPSRACSRHGALSPRTLAIAMFHS